MKFNLKIALLVLTICAICFSIYSAKRLALQEKERSATKEFFRHVALAILNYESAYQELPRPVVYSNGEHRIPYDPNDDLCSPIYSWRHELAGFMEGGSSPPAPMRRAWDNAELQSHFQQYTKRYLNLNEKSETPMFAISGPGTAFGGGTNNPLGLNELCEEAILFLEVVDSATHWMQPGDFHVDKMPNEVSGESGPRIGSPHPGGFHVAFADAEVWFISDRIPFSKLQKFFRNEDAKQYSREAVLGPYAISK